MTPTPIDRRVFVVGVPRSGTTLVQSLLASHSAMTSFTESHLFSRHFRLLPALDTPVLLHDPGPRLQEFLLENRDDTGAALSLTERDVRQISPPRLLMPFRTRAVAKHLIRVLDQLAVSRGRSSWIEKTCRHLRYIPFFETLLGAAGRMQFVHVVRDGLEAVASLHVASRHWERPYSLEECVKRWNHDVEFSLTRVSSPHDHVVFYEELTEHPQDTMERLVAALGLSWEPSLLETYAHTSRQLIAKGETWKGNVANDIRRSATSQRVLTLTQRTQITRTLRTDLYAELHRRVVGSRDRSNRSTPRQ